MKIHDTNTLPLTGQSGLGYGTITPTHKTSTTRTAITDQAGLSHINTKNFKQEEVQNQLNPIITNDFNKEQVLTELGAQVVITTEFSKEAPKAVAKFADKQAFKLIQNLDELNNKNIDITSDEYQNTIKEIDKWSEGGVYRTALHTAMGLFATGTVEGGLSAGTTAYTIPKIDEYLKEQGFDKEVRDTALLALSAVIGATVGDSTASTANNVGQTEWNYLSHRELSAWKTSLIKCAGNQQCIDNVNAKYDNLNKTNFDNFKNYCTINFDAQRCHNRIRRFEDGTQGNLSGLYTDISRLGGKDANKTITSVKFNNAFGGHTVRDTGIANINRDNGNEFQALVGELANERLYGGGRGGTVAGSGGYRVGVVNSGSNRSSIFANTQEATDAAKALGYQKNTPISF